MTAREKQRVHDLACRLAEYAAEPRMEDLRREWVRHNAMRPGRPLLLIHPEGSWPELLPPSRLECEDRVAREVEYKLLVRLTQHDLLRDDMVYEPEFLVPKIIDYTTFLPSRSVYRTTTDCFHIGLARPVTGWVLDPVSGFIPAVWDPQREVQEDRGDHYDIVLQDRGDLDSYRTPCVVYREAETLAKVSIVQESIGDVLRVAVAGVVHCSFHLASTYCSLRGGMMNMLYDLADQRELVTPTMEKLRDMNIELTREYERQGLLSLNNGGYLQSTGGLSYTDELPAADFAGRVRPIDMWASCESQELSHVSPEMHRDCVMRYEVDILRLFGLAGYGCCEPLEHKLSFLLKLSNLRRISCSPFADVRLFAEALERKGILSWKPDPSMIARGLAEEDMIPYLATSIRKARGSQLEITLKDTNTCGSDPQRFVRWMSAARHAIEEAWEG